MSAPPLKPHIRWLIRRDLAEVQAIENDVFTHPWLERDFVRTLARRNCIGRVAEYCEQVVGYFIYEMNKTNIVLLNIAVAPEYQGRGIGRAMISRLLELLGGRRTKLIVPVSERNLPAHKFLQVLGFLAVRVERNYNRDFCGCEDSAYIFEWSANTQEFSSPQGSQTR